MGHVFDKTSCFLIPAAPADYAIAAGAATVTTPKVGGQWIYKIVAGGAGASVVVKIAVSTQHSAFSSTTGKQKGFNFRSLDLWYYNSVAVSSLNLAIYLETLPADGAAFGAPASQAFTYDTGHDTNGERVDLVAPYHKMTLTITAPFWLVSEKICYVEWAISLGNNGEIYLLRYRVNGYLRF